MTRPSELLSCHTDPGALFNLAHELVKALGHDGALRRSDFYDTIATSMQRVGVPGVAYEQTRDAIREAVAVQRAVDRDNANTLTAAEVEQAYDDDYERGCRACAYTFSFDPCQECGRVTAEAA